ncbi:MAG: S41 family peptidase, partial [Synergistaceae bacterium]|nr:S41 family peptidase [Synergistaceae bacterium]
AATASAATASAATTSAATTSAATTSAATASAAINMASATQAPSRAEYLVAAMRMIVNDHIDDVSLEYMLGNAAESLINSSDLGWFLRKEWMAYSNATLLGLEQTRGLDALYIGDELIIVGVNPDSDAYKKGLRKGMVIESVNGYPITPTSFEWAEEFFSFGKTSRIKAFDYQTEKSENYLVEDNNIMAIPLDRRTISEIEVIKINSFNDLLYDALSGELDDIVRKGKRDLVIDIRGCDTGSFENAEKALSLITGSQRRFGELVSDTGEVLRSFFSGNTEIEFNLAVLTDGNTSGAAELFASAVKTENRSSMVVIGTQTAGDTAVNKYYEILNPAAYAVYSRENPGMSVIVDELNEENGFSLEEEDILGYVSIVSDRFIDSEGDDLFGLGVGPDIWALSSFSPYSILPRHIKKLNTAGTTGEGQRSVDVLFAKSILMYLGYTIDDESIYFDNDFKVALMDFQSGKGLRVTGQLDIATKRALNGLIESVVMEFDSAISAAVNYLAGNSQQNSGKPGGAGRYSEADGVSYRLPVKDVVVKPTGIRASTGGATAASAVPAAATSSGQLTYRNSAAYINAIEKLITEKLISEEWDDYDYMYENALIAIFSSADVYTRYYAPDEEEELISFIFGTSEGIGVYLDKIGKDIVILEVFKDSGAQKAGLKPGDIIVAIDGVSIENASTDLVRNLILNSGKRRVILKIKRDKHEDLLNFIVSKRAVHPEFVESRIIEEAGEKIGYIKITEFTVYTSDEFQSVIESFHKDGIEKLILDLRDNPGGDLECVIEIAGMLLPESVIAKLEYKSDRIENKVFYSEPSEWDRFEIVTLVNEYTASASEILTGALKDNKASVIVGARTYGKARVQAFFDILSYDGYIKARSFSVDTVNAGELPAYVLWEMGDEDLAGWLAMTCGIYKTPNGNMIDKKGILPHRLVYISQQRELVEMLNVKDMTCTDDIEIGDVDLNIYYLKRLFLLTGYYEASADLEFDDKTSASLREFCSDRGLTYRGVFDVELQKEINKFIEEQRIVHDDQFATAIKIIKHD